MISFKALAVPIALAGASGFGENPNSRAVSAVIMVALTGYDTAEVIHKIMAKASTPIIR